MNVYEDKQEVGGISREMYTWKRLTFPFVWHSWGMHDPMPSLPEMRKTIFRKSLHLRCKWEKGKQHSQNKSSAQNKHLQDLLNVFSSSFLSSSWSLLMFCIMTNKQSKLYNTSKISIKKKRSLCKTYLSDSFSVSNFKNFITVSVKQTNSFTNAFV